MPDVPDPAISKAQELWQQGQNKRAMLVLVRRINELNAVQLDRQTKGKRSLFVGILTGMFLIAVIFLIALAGSPNLRWLSSADLTQLKGGNVVILLTPTPLPSDTPNWMTLDVISAYTEVALTNEALQQDYDLTVTALSEIERATQTSIAETEAAATQTAVARTQAAATRTAVAKTQAAIQVATESP
jgi:hypothetical protein